MILHLTLFAGLKLPFSTKKGFWKSIKADDGAAGYDSGLILLLLPVMQSICGEMSGWEWRLGLAPATEDMV
jgi:hypothetical protein